VNNPEQPAKRMELVSDIVLSQRARSHTTHAQIPTQATTTVALPLGSANGSIARNTTTEIPTIKRQSQIVSAL
jgi:hypothetical protein